MDMLKNASRALCFALLAAAAGCGEGVTSPITFVGPANLVVTDLRLGDGAVLAVGQTATVHYKLWLYDPTGSELKGQLLEDSRLGGPPAGYPLRIVAGQIIQGWVEGVPGMKVGGQRRLIIPPALAYGSTGSGGIPPNAWLVFDIELLAVAD
jgi:FKBP-type peptidyl-prolyl cis-trans isomerase